MGDHANTMDDAFLVVVIGVSLLAFVTATVLVGSIALVAWVVLG